MTSLPLHPAIVHLPLGLAFVIPAIAAGFAWAVWRGGLRRRAWLSIIALQAVLLGAGLAAMNTGEREEDRVERAVPRSAIHTHEEYAEQFLWASGVTLVLATLVLVSRKPAFAKAVTVATVAGTFVVAGTAIRVGHAGGQLVYVHNAGAAYGSLAKTSGADKASSTSVGGAQRGDEEDR